MFRLYGDGKIDIYFLTGSENCKLLLGDASFSVFLFFVGWGGQARLGTDLQNLGSRKLCHPFLSFGVTVPCEGMSHIPYEELLLV